MSEILKLVIICAVMGISSYAVGLVPLSFPLSAPKIRAISVLGSGILVGTALVVIIPEGVSMLYTVSAAPDPDTHNDIRPRHGGGGGEQRGQVGLALLLGFIFMYIIEKLPFLIAAFGELAAAVLPSRRGQSFSPLSSIDMTSIRHTIVGGLTPARSGPQSPVTGSVSPSTLESGAAHDPPRHSMGAGRSPYDHHHRTDSVLPPSGSAAPGADPASPTATSASSNSTALGLIIHAVADGIALGASVASGDSSVEAIVFLAIMIHKAPASFGLSAVVLQTEGAAGAKRTLAWFAAAAPFGALLTYLIIMGLGSGHGGALINWWTGILLLFSGGTFLYVAVHVMQELDQIPHGHGEAAYNSTNTAATGGADALLGIIGMLLPLLTLFVPED